MSRFDGLVALVTGGGSGIGAATALRLAREGARVVVVGRTADKLERTAVAETEGRVHTRVADVTAPDEVDRALEWVVGELGRLDIVVNAAASNHYGTVEGTTDSEWRTVFATTVDAAFYVARAAMPHLRAQRGCIVNVGSISASGADRGHAAYVSAKGALTQLTNALALDHGETVRVNAVHPGFTLGTEMTAAVAEHPQVIDIYSRAIPRGRPAQPDEVAQCIAFLASADAGYVNGAHLAVDGGLSATAGQPDLA